MQTQNPNWIVPTAPAGSNDNRAASTSFVLANGAGPAVVSVKNFGAIGNGVTDDTAAINSAIAAFNTAGRGVLYFPAGTYLCSAALTAITAIGSIRGDGATNLNTDASVSAVPGTLITCTSATAALFTINSQTIIIKELSLQNTSGTTPTAGAGILVTSTLTNQKVDYQSISISGFFINIDSRSGAAWTLHNFVLNDPVQHGVSLQNINTADAGDWSMSDGVLSCRLSRSPTGSAVLQQSSGGGKIVNVKVNGGAPAPGGGKFVNGFNITATATSIFLLANVSVENYSGQALIFNNANLTMLTNVEVGHYNNSNTPACNFAFCHGLVISGLVGAQSGGGSVVLCNFNSNCTGVVLGPITTTSGFSGGNFTGLNTLALQNGLQAGTGNTDVATIRAILSPSVMIGSRFTVNNTTQASPTLGQLVAAADAGGTNIQPVFFDGTAWRYG